MGRDNHRLAVMQPYLFPYIGYYQLVASVDVFVFYNDVNFIKRGWINRNRILLNGKDYLFTVPIKNASQNRKICDTAIVQDTTYFEKIISTIEIAYKKAPYFSEVMPLIQSVFNPIPEYIDELASNSIKVFSDYIGLETKFKSSKDKYDNSSLSREDKLISICQSEGANTYINALGGAALYLKENFSKQGISLFFLNTEKIVYPQFNHEFVANLSMIDVAMFNDRNALRKLLNQYVLT